ncbi:MAG TPA: hypothetical protein VFV07_09945 [Rhizomicrobium sp.]|nr:hypothetical protein [Rhizomicrobium sp.]
MARKAKKKASRSARKSPAELGHAELAALDFVILNALQRGAKPDDKVVFLDAIGNALVQAVGMIPADDVGNDVEQTVDAATGVAEALAEIFGSKLEPGAADALMSVGAATLNAPAKMSLKQLIDMRRKAVASGRGKRKS